MTLVIHLGRCAIWRSWVARVLNLAVVRVLLELLNTTGRSGLVLSRDMCARLVSDRWKLNWGTTSLLIARGWGTFAGLAFSSGTDSSSASTLLISLTHVLFLLFTSLPLLSDFLEFCGRVIR
jgi:hypothetical protein